MAFKNSLGGHLADVLLCESQDAHIRCSAEFVQGLIAGLDGVTVTWHFTGLAFYKNGRDPICDESVSDIFMDGSGSASERSSLAPAVRVGAGGVLLSWRRNGGLNPQFVARLRLKSPK